MHDSPLDALSVLLVGENPDDRAFVRSALGAVAAPGFRVDCVDSLAATHEHLTSERFDVVLMDLRLPDAAKERVLEGIATLAKRIPVVVLTGWADDELGLAAVREGAQDFLVKGQTSGNLLAKALRYAVERHRMRGEIEQRTQGESQLRAQLLHADKLTELGRLLAGVAHELKAPIGSVLGFAELLSDELTLDAESRRKMDLLVGEAQRARRIVLELTAFSKPAKGARRVLSLNAAVESTMDLLGSSLRVQQIDLELLLDPSAGSVSADPDRIRQVLINLVGNAVEAMRAERDRGRLRVSTRAAAGSVELWVEDDGPGVPEDLRTRIFEPFVSTKSERGTGLGLSIVAGIVEEYGGSIQVDPAAGDLSGGRFVVTLPTTAETDGGEP